MVPLFQGGHERQEGKGGSYRMEGIRTSSLAGGGKMRRKGEFQQMKFRAMPGLQGRKDMRFRESIRRDTRGEMNK